MIFDQHASSLCLATVVLLCSHAAGDGTQESTAGLDLSPAAVTIQPAPAEPPVAESSEAGVRPRFGAEGSKWWTVGAGVGGDFDGTDSVNVFGTFGYFVVEDVELQGELGLWYFSQPGDDALGIAPVFNIRWHFLNRDTWTLYADVGIGILAATDDVPSGGTSFDFTPRLGIGWTQQLTDSGTRLVLGARWQHFSNARIFGDDDNPGLDEGMLYAGIMFPF